jgi:hypothetical protein
MRPDIMMMAVSGSRARIAVEVGQVVVKEGHTRLQLLGQRQRRRAVVGSLNGEPGAGQECGHLLALDDVVLDDQHITLGGGPLGVRNDVRHAGNMSLGTGRRTANWLHYG